MVDTIIEILNEITGADEGEIRPDSELFAEGILDSFGLVQLLVALEDQGCALDAAELDRDRISTPEKITALAEQAK